MVQLTSITDSILLSRDRDGVRVLTLNRPEKKNAFTGALAIALESAFDAAATDDAVKVVVVQGAGGDFTAGADVTLFLARSEEERAAAMRVGQVHRFVRAFPKPLIAAVQGQAVGMGVTMLPHFDLVFAADDATFTTPFVRLGLVQEFGSSWTLPRAIGRQRANELILGARPIDAATALAWGLVNAVYPVRDLLDEVLGRAAAMAQCPSAASVAAKALLMQGEDASLDETIAAENEALMRFYGGPENRAVVEAFLASRAVRRG